MLFAPHIRDSVCFVYANMKGVLKPKGTAFFVALPIGETGLDTTIIVTALHVVAKIEAQSDDGRAYLRVNAKDGGFLFAEVDPTDWFRPDHSDEVVDVVFCPWTASQADADIKSIPVRYAATADVMAAEDLGVGNEVFIVGLFVNHHGKKRNEPIVRVGNLSAMPSDPVSTRVGDLQAYFIEARSLGGLSGSPVWIDAGVFRVVDGRRQYRRGGQPLSLLGIMHGHFQVPRDDVPPDDDRDTPQQAQTEYVNMGIAIVTPIDKLLTLIDQSPIPARIAAAAEKLADHKGPPPEIVDVEIDWPPTERP